MASYVDYIPSLEVLSEGQTLRFSIGGEEHQAVVLRIHRDTLPAQLTVQTEQDLMQVSWLKEGLLLPVSFTKNISGRNYLFAFDSTILDFRTDHNKVLASISLPLYLARKESRNDFRISISVNGLFYRHGREQEPVAFVTKDLSIGGMQALSPVLIEVGSAGAVTLEIPATGIPALNARIIHSNRYTDGEQWVLGIQFIGMARDVEDILFGLLLEWEKGLKVFKSKRAKFPFGW